MSEEHPSTEDLLALQKGDDVDTATIPLRSRLTHAARQGLRRIGMLAPRLPKYLGALCEVPG